MDIQGPIGKIVSKHDNQSLDSTVTQATGKDGHEILERKIKDKVTNSILENVDVETGTAARGKEEVEKIELEDTDEDQEIVREVSGKEETCYFVNVSEWEGDDIVAEAARYQDVQERIEEVASSRRNKWAEEFILSGVWERAKLRQDVRRWSRQVILKHLSQVILTREIIFETLGDAVRSVETKKTEKRLNLVKRNKEELIMTLEARMDVVDIDKENRLDKARELR